MTSRYLLRVPYISVLLEGEETCNFRLLKEVRDGLALFAMNSYLTFIRDIVMHAGTPCNVTFIYLLGPCGSSKIPR
jgi:hypothetical protein